MDFTGQDQRLLSEKLLLFLKVIDREDIRRECFDALLHLDHGFWQHDNTTQPESLRGYTVRVGRIALDLARIRGATGSGLDAEDLSHEMLIAFYQQARQIRSNPRGWFVGVAVRIIKSRQRKQRYAHTSPAELDNIAMPDRSREPRTSTHLRQMRKTISRLPPDARHVLNAHLAGKSAPEIAQDLGTNAVTVRQRLRRARQLLRTLVRDRYSERQAA